MSYYQDMKSQGIQGIQPCSIQYSQFNNLWMISPVKVYDLNEMELGFDGGCFIANGEG